MLRLICRCYLLTLANRLEWSTSYRRDQGRHRLSEHRSNGPSEWRQRAVTAERAVTTVQRGDRVFVGSACATPRTLLRALEALSPPPAGV